jgi:hypothetical protein
VSAAQLKRVPATGGAVETIAELPNLFGLGGDAATWDDKGHVIVTQGTTRGLIEIPEHGGEPRTILAADTTRESDFHEPFLLPGDRGMLLVAHRKQGIDNISLLRAASSRRSSSCPNSCWTPAVLAHGPHRLRARHAAGGIWAVPFSLASLRTTGEPSSSSRGAWHRASGRTAASSTSRPRRSPRSSAGSIAPARSCSTWRNSAAQPRMGGVFDVSPDGTRAVVTLGSTADLWVYDFVRASRLQLTKSPGLEVNGVFTARREVDRVPGAPERTAPDLTGWCLIRQIADGTGRRTHSSRRHATPSISADGRTIYYSHITGPSGMDARVADPRVDCRARRPDGRPADHVLSAPVAGRSVAGLLRERRPAERQPPVVLMSLQSGSRAVIGNGLWPQWNERGDRLYFVQGDDVMEVKVGKGIRRSPRRRSGCSRARTSS